MEDDKHLSRMSHSFVQKLRKKKPREERPAEEDERLDRAISFVESRKAKQKLEDEDEKVESLVKERKKSRRTAAVKPQKVQNIHSLQPGDRFANFEIIKELGRGGMGRVYLTKDGINREIALKIVVNSSPEYRERFKREASVTALLAHPNITPLYMFDIYEDTPYLVMQYVDGLPLLAHINHKNLSITERVKLFVPVVRAVAYAHKKGILHRDIKPANILVEKDIPYLMDFGLAKVVSGSAPSLTISGEVVGTVKYMSPEQAEGKPLDERADIYSLGATLYHVLTGAPPFEGSTANLMYKILEDNPISPQKINSEIPPTLAKVCLKCLAKDSRDRYANAEILARALLAAIIGRRRKSRITETATEENTPAMFFIGLLTVVAVLASALLLILASL